MSTSGEETGGLAGACSAADAQPVEGAEHGAGACPAPQPSKHCPTDFIIEAPETILSCDGAPVRLKAKDMKGFSGGRFTWETSCLNLELGGERGRSIRVRGRNQVSARRDAETIRVTRKSRGCPDLSKVVKLTVAKLTFSNSATSAFGYDDYDLIDPWKRHGSALHHVSIEADKESSVHVVIEGGPVGTDFDFRCKGGPRKPCVPSGAMGSARFDLKLKAGGAQTKPQILEARTVTSGKTLFGELAIPVYKDKLIQVVIGKFDDPLVLPLFGMRIYHLSHPHQDYTTHEADTNNKMREAVVKFRIFNLFAENPVTEFAFTSGLPEFAYDINAGGGPDLARLRRIFLGRDPKPGTRTRITGRVIRVAIVPDLKSYYYLARAVKAGSKIIRLRGGHTWFTKDMSPAIGTGLALENVIIKKVVKDAGVIHCDPLAFDHPAGTPLEFPAAAWSSDPILIKDNIPDILETMWTVPHEVSHVAFDLNDLDDETDVMHNNQGNTDHRVRHSPRPHYYDKKKDKQWDMMHKR